MEYRYLKDFAIILVVIMLAVFAYMVYRHYETVSKVPMDSKYKNLSLSDDLLKQIQEIEMTIIDRKNFVFTVQKDPLEQNLIVKTMIDLEKEWVKRVQSMLRLASTLIDEDGNKRAAFAYHGEMHLLKVGDRIAGYNIGEIHDGFVMVESNSGMKAKLETEAIPDKPVKIQEAAKTREYVW